MVKNWNDWEVQTVETQRFRRKNMYWFQEGIVKLVLSITDSSVVAKNMGKSGGIEALWHVEISEVYEQGNYFLNDRRNDTIIISIHYELMTIL